MVTKKENLKETEIFLSFDAKTVDTDIKKVLEDIDKIKKQPFQDIFVMVEKEFPKDYFFKLVKDLNYKNVLIKEKQIIIKIS
jgi:hypothetical protein